MTVSLTRAAVIALLAAGLLAACGTNDNAAAPPRTTPPPKPTKTTKTSAPADPPHTLAELVDDPCRALNDADTAAVGAILDPLVQGTDEKYCLWFTAAGGVSFTPYPSADLTADPANQQNMTATEVSGHRALLGVLVKDRGCSMYVSFGAGASFKLGESRDSQNRPPPGTCPLSPKFAAAIVANLR